MLKISINKSKLRIASLVACLLVLLSLPVIYYLLPDYTNAVSEQQKLSGTVVTDRHGNLLRIFPDFKDRFTLWSKIDNIPTVVIQAVIAAEDRRFYYHPGFDPIAIARAVYVNVGSGKIVSGASTITQQVVRLIRPRPRTYRSKIVELFAAMKMEWQLSKNEILELHLNLSPTGGNLQGVTLAARTYFGKGLNFLNAAEAAALAALPRSPTRFDPRHAAGKKNLEAEKDNILRRMLGLEMITEAQFNAMKGPIPSIANRPFPLEAAHLVDLMLKGGSDRINPLRTTVDMDVQRAVETILKSHKPSLSRLGIEQAGALVVDSENTEVLAMIGSLEYGEKSLGYNNAVLANRGAGSTLKPFLYALALESGQGAASEIPDTFRSYTTPHGDYLPFNADRRWYGPVNIRLALGNSLNMPAVRMLSAVGTHEFYNLLEQIDLINENSLSAEEYGLGLAIGNVEVSLFNLVQAYTALARGGLFRPLKLLPEKQIRSVRVLSPEAVYIINNILSDPSARLLTFGNPSYFDFGFPVCIKTGTSSNYRDSWIIAYTPKHIVGLWAGNFSGRPTGNATGATALGPILGQIVRALYGASKPEPFQRPAKVQEEQICWYSGKTAKPSCPYQTRELVIAGLGGSVCDLPHDDDQRLLGGNYAQWLHRRELKHGEGRFKLDTDGSISPEEDTASRAGRIKPRVEIVSPHHLDHFILSSGADQVILRAIPDPVVKDITWYIDGFEISKSSSPFEHTWKLVRGKHVINAVTPDRYAAEIVIFVE